MSVVINYTGSKYNHLTLLYSVGPGKKGSGTIWRARCDCGIEVDVPARRVAAGLRKTCGKCQLSRRLMSEGGKKNVFRRDSERVLYQKKASAEVTRGNSWSLLPGEFLVLIRKCCMICRSEPRQRMKGPKYPRNRITRMDESKGWTIQNTITVCDTCSRWKSGINLLTFLEHSKLIVNGIPELLRDLQART